VKLSPDQKEVFEAMRDFANGNCDAGNDLMTVGGFAGTGKSTVLGVFAAQMKEDGVLPAYVAPTGRAASVLRKKLTACGIHTTKIRGFAGVPYCGTIHGLTKFPAVNPKGELVGFQNAPGLGDRYNLLVVDEASMVGGEMLAHLQSFQLPILAVGDHGQLPPVLDTAGLMENPDFRLEKIHRQAAGNPIIALSARVRETGELDEKLQDGVALRIVGRRAGRELITEQLRNKKISPFEKAIICSYNRTRVELNRYARDALGVTTRPVYPKKGDLVICLKNLHALGIMNGMRGVMLSDAEQSETTPWQITGAMEFPDEEIRVSGEWLLERFGGMCWPGFMREKPFQTVDEFNKEVVGFCDDIGVDAGGEEPTTHMKDQGWPFDFGYALTCHKAQGSQFSRVAVWLDRRPEPESEDYRKWLYTSCTRATERLLVVE
jgi:ATP-dependent exoDNAse (exonuclease V) alpha subunit